MRAGLAMYFVTLEDAALMEIADRIVAELGIEHFFNIQLVGEHVIEINPRISTVVYQEDLNIPYLGVKRALGEISADELVALRSRDPARAGRRCATSTSSSGTRDRDAARSRRRPWATCDREAFFIPSLTPTHPGARAQYRGGVTCQCRIVPGVSRLLHG